MARWPGQIFGAPIFPDSDPPPQALFGSIFHGYPMLQTRDDPWPIFSLSFFCDADMLRRLLSGIAYNMWKENLLKFISYSFSSILWIAVFSGLCPCENSQKSSGVRRRLTNHCKYQYKFTLITCALFCTIKIGYIWVNLRFRSYANVIGWRLVLSETQELSDFINCRCSRKPEVNFPVFNFFVFLIKMMFWWKNSS